MLEISKKLFDSWNNNNLNYCHWKSNEHLSEGLDGITDLDVLLDADHKQIGHKLLKKCQFLSCCSQFGSRYPNVEDWLGFDCETGKLVHLHLHYKMITGHKGMKEYTLPWSDEVLLTKVMDECTGVYVADPNYEILTLYTRFGLKAHYKQIKKARIGNFCIGKDNIKEITYLKERIDWIRVADIIKKYFGSDSDSFLQLMKKDVITGSDFLLIRKLAEKNFRNCRRYSSLGVFCRTLVYHSAGHFQALIKRMGRLPITRKTPISSKAPIIAVLGQDGAGKSTVVKDIRKWLSWKLDICQFYLGSGDHYQPWEKRMQSCLHGSNNPCAKLIRKWLPFLYLSKLGKYVYKTVVKANKYAHKGGIVLYDRYPQTEYVGINDGPKIRTSIMQHVNGGLLYILANHYAKKEEKYLRKATLYSPDVVIKLMLTPEESIRRKPHENYEAVKEKHEIIKSLKFDNAAVYTVDATQAYDNEIIEIKNIIWQNILKS